MRMRTAVAQLSARRRVSKWRWQREMMNRVAPVVAAVAVVVAQFETTIRESRRRESGPSRKGEQGSNKKKNKKKE
jgi:adenylosuccinate lyase